MITIEETPAFKKWRTGLKDRTAAGIVVDRLVRLSGGNFGDVKWFGGIGEMRIDYGPGYRIYLMQRGTTIVLLLRGGTKRTQEEDINRAKRMAKEQKR